MSFNPATDRRLNPVVPARAAPRRARIAVPVADLRPEPVPTTGIDTQMLLGAPVQIHDEQEGWAYVQALADSYCGWCALSALGDVDPAPTHRVIVPRSFVYMGADMKFPRVDVLSMGSAVTITGQSEKRGTAYALLDGGTAMIAAHLAPLETALPDPVSVAETLLHTPYLWGGASAFGIDCSALVQLSHAMAGIHLLRDTDMQAATAGRAIAPDALRRGDLVFWKGHVAIMLDAAHIIHANGHTMSVAIEPYAAAVERIGYLYGQPTGFRRLQ